jgi:hypothetical protein
MQLVRFKHPVIRQKINQSLGMIRDKGLKMHLLSPLRPQKTHEEQKD